MAWREVVHSSSKLQVSLSADGLLGHHGDSVQLVRSDRVLLQLLLDQRPDPLREHELKQSAGRSLYACMVSAKRRRFAVLGLALLLLLGGGAALLSAGGNGSDTRRAASKNASSTTTTTTSMLTTTTALAALPCGGAQGVRDTFRGTDDAGGFSTEATISKVDATWALAISRPRPGSPSSSRVGYSLVSCDGRTWVVTDFGPIEELPNCSAPPAAVRAELCTART